MSAITTSNGTSSMSIKSISAVTFFAVCFPSSALCLAKIIAMLHSRCCMAYMSAVIPSLLTTPASYEARIETHVGLLVITAYIRADRPSISVIFASLSAKSWTMSSCPASVAYMSALFFKLSTIPSSLPVVRRHEMISV